jgi:choline dehydrogenase-like flavoprotein
MLVDASSLNGKDLEADVCIIGAGPAGIEIARELSRHGLSVIMLESGGELAENAAQEPNRGKSVGYPYYPLQEPRTRAFGGSISRSLDFGWRATPLWGIDFEQRAWVEHSGWPFGLAELLPYYRRAHEVSGLKGKFDYQAGAWEDEEAPQLGQAHDGLNGLIFQISPKNYFHARFAEVAAATSIQLLLRSTVVKVLTTPAGDEVTGVRVVAPDGRRFVVSAARYILACGGIDNPRLLLASDDANPAGLGNQNGNVGRYFMEHLLFTTGYVKLRDTSVLSRLRFYEQHDAGDARIEAWLTLPEDAFRSARMQGAAFSLRPTTSLELQPSIVAARSLSQLRWREPSRFQPLAYATKTALGLPSVLQFALKRGGDRDVLALDVVAEQAPNAASRVTLADDADSFGVRRAVLDWRPAPSDFASIAGVQAALGEALHKLGVGEVVSMIGGAYAPPLSGVGHHHLGTTRMSDDPRSGVVDSDGKVHGVSNLFVTGGSVFPTGGFIPPTLTILALALRLAGHLVATRAAASSGARAT